MLNVYYTRIEGRRNACGHTRTRGTVYAIKPGKDTLECLGDYVHQSGGAGLSCSILSVVENAGIYTNGGYYGHWREAVNLIEL